MDVVILSPHFPPSMALSGLFQLRHFVGGHMDDAVHLSSPLRFLPGLDDPSILERLGV